MALDAVALAIHAVVDIVTLVIQPSINTVALAVTAGGQTLFALRRGTLGSTIKPSVYAVSLLVQTMFDTITLAIQLIIYVLPVTTAVCCGQRAAHEQG
jgi:hypothetical protein